MLRRAIMLAALSGAVALPPSTHAQAPTTTAGAMAAPADVFDKLLANEEKEIVGAAEAMPADKFNYAPTAGEFKGVRTFSSQLKHLAEANYGLFRGWNIPNAKTGADIEKLTGRDEILQALRDSFAYAHAAMQSINATNAFAEMGEHKTTRAGTATLGLAHMMDHYGQLVEYLRMNGVVPPASRGGM